MSLLLENSQQRSYRDLPQRYSEMGTVYRAELSGTLHGLMRVRGFTVDDAHLFCTPELSRGTLNKRPDLGKTRRRGKIDEWNARE